MRSRASRHCSRRAILQVYLISDTCLQGYRLWLSGQRSLVLCLCLGGSTLLWGADETVSAGVARPCTCIGITSARRSLGKQFSASAVSVGRRGCLPWSPLLLLKSLNCKQKPGSFAFLKNMRSYNCAFHHLRCFCTYVPPANTHLYAGARKDTASCVARTCLCCASCTLQLM